MIKAVTLEKYSRECLFKIANMSDLEKKIHIDGNIPFEQDLTYKVLQEYYEKLKKNAPRSSDGYYAVQTSHMSRVLRLLVNKFEF